MTLAELAEAAGCTKGYLSTIENERRTGPPSDEVLSRLEWALRLEAGVLVEAARWETTPEPVRRRVEEMEEERTVARRLARMLRDQGVDALHKSGELREMVARLAPDEERRAGGGVEAGNLARVLPMRVPLINRVAAGYPTEFTDLGYPARVADEYVGVPDVYDPDAFAARVVGDSMEPRYREGDIVVFSPLAATRDGSDCFVRFERDEETTFKRIYFSRTEDGREMIRLQPLNSAYEARTVEREEVAGMYAAVYVVREVTSAE